MSQIEDTPLIQITRKGDSSDKNKPAMCSRCGLCYSVHRDKLTEACVFVQNRYEQIEERIHGRGRKPDTDEDMFGIFRQMYIAKMSKPVENSQWSGMVTTLATMLLEKKMVDGVICVLNVPGTRFKPMPIFAQNVKDLRASAGNKPCLSQNLSALTQAQKSGAKRIAFIGNGCQTHALRAIEHKLPFEKVYFIGLPCTDVVTYQKWNKFLDVITPSPQTVVHLEFMPDYRVWMRHEDGHIEKVPFVALDVAKLGAEIFPHSCTSCFDYANSLSDLTIGYLGAQMPYQWVTVRTETGSELFEMLRPYLDFAPMQEGGDWHKAVRVNIDMLDKPPRKLPRWGAELLGFVMRKRGLKGINFARGTLTMKWARNMKFIQDNYPEDSERLIPGFARRHLKQFGMEYKGPPAKK